jgi:hypothetical protein
MSEEGMGKGMHACMGEVVALLTLCSPGLYYRKSRFFWEFSVGQLVQSVVKWNLEYDCMEYLVRCVLFYMSK